MNRKLKRWQIHKDVIVIKGATLTLDDYAKASEIVSAIRSEFAHAIPYPIVALGDRGEWNQVCHNGETFSHFADLCAPSLDEACANVGSWMGVK